MRERMDLSPAERENVRRCLDLLEQAQHLVNEAACALSPVRGFAREWSELAEPYETIKRHWHQIDGRRAGMIRDRASED